MSGFQEEIEQTHEALKCILDDDHTFKYVVGEVFATIDTDKSGRLKKEELRQFVVKVCHDKGMKTTPEDQTIDEVFKDLDEDNSDDITNEEFSVFLRRLFITQREEYARALNKN